MQDWVLKYEEAMRKYEKSIKEALRSVKGLDRQWRSDVVEKEDGTVYVRKPLRGAYESLNERKGKERVVVTVEGWDPEAIAEYDSCDTAERELEREGAEDTLFNNLAELALEQIVKELQS